MDHVHDIEAGVREALSTVPTPDDEGEQQTEAVTDSVLGDD